MSIYSQTRLPDEVILVDNNCTDNSVEIAAQFPARIIHEPVQGIWAAAAKGYDAVRSDIIVRCDADSIAPPEWLYQIEQSLFQNDYIAITGPGKFYDVSKVAAVVADTVYMKAYFVLVGSALAGPPVFGSNFAFRRSAWQKIATHVHSNREDIHDDIDLSYHLQENGVIHYDRTLIVGISGRPLTDYAGMTRRIAKGFRSLFIHWPQFSPWRLYRMRIRKQ